MHLTLSSTWYLWNWDIIDAELAIQPSRVTVAMIPANANDGTAWGVFSGDPNPVTSIPANANADAGTNARWGSLHEAYHNEALASYTDSGDVSSEPIPADRKFFEGQPEVAPEVQPHVPMANNKLQ